MLEIMFHFITQSIFLTTEVKARASNAYMGTNGLLRSAESYNHSFNF